MKNLNDFKRHAVDWRAQIRLNQRKTRQVIAVFILLYISVGLVCDVLLYSNQYARPNLTLIFSAMIHGEIFPYATFFGLLAAVIALSVTYILYDRLMLLGTEYREILPDNSSDLTEKQLFNVVEEMKVAAGLTYLPRIFIIEADYMNAFASGYSEKSSMVAITRGLLNKLTRSELQAVMAHELSHIRHLDIKLTLTIAVLTNIILIVLDLLFYRVIYGERRRADNRVFMLIILLRYSLPFITTLLMLYLSRTREYLADAGCVELMRDNEPLARALLKIHQDHQINAETYRQAYGQTPHEEVRRGAYLYDPVKAKIEPVKDFASWFSTHPPMEDRLKAIGFEPYDHHSKI